MDDAQPDHVFLGTPLEELDQDEIPRKKFQPDLTVRDAQGRRRFHGAFTGGFSAGFYNTVGTKEGWTPATFKSSKSNKSDNVPLQPEDFMDEEDLGEFGIAPRKIQVKEDFVDFAEQKKRVREPPRMNVGPIPGSPPLKNLFKPVSQSIGVKLLNCMGWRQGQGIGPRLTRKDKKQKEQNSARVYGCALPPSAESSDEEDERAELHLFAPSDIDNIIYAPKNNLHGIGYVALDKHSVLAAPIDLDQPTTTKGHLEKGKRKLAISGQAFGVGAFEEEDGDIYAREDMSQYDFTLGDELEDKPRKTTLSIHEGRGKSLHHITKTLEGFHLAKDPPTVRKHYPPPQIPADFEPFHHGPKKERRRFEEPKANLYKEDRKEHSGSIFDLISPADKARLENIKQGGSSGQAKEAAKDESATHTELSDSPAGPTKPFARDEAKQKRFEQYLSLLSSKRIELFPAMQPLHMTEWEKERECKEFQRAAMICQPTQSLGSRFVSTRTLKDDDSVDVTVDKAEETEDAAKAAHLGMFGKLTHEEFEWHPADLLCRRFNVPNPYPNCEKVGLATVKMDKYSVFNFLNVPHTEGSAEEASESTVEVDKSYGDHQSEKPSLSRVQPAGENRDAAMEEDDGEEDGTEPTEERPPLSVFKSIFSESSSEGEDEENTTESNAQKVSEETKTSRPNMQSSAISMEQAVKRPLRPAMGVFANLDFERLNQRPPAVPVEELHPKSLLEEHKAAGAKMGGEPSQCGSDVSNLYGPRLPPTGVSSAAQSQSEPPKGHHSKKQKKKSHTSKADKKHKKHKSKQKKHKKHSKKHSKNKASKSDSSSDDSSDYTDEERHTQPSCKDIISRLNKLRKHL
ncbi:G patch domain-containing protein 1 [Ixodes scapularis]